MERVWGSLGHVPRSIILWSSEDVADSVGKAGFFESRVQGRAGDLEIRTTRPRRSDLLTSVDPAPEDAPPEVSACFSVLEPDVDGSTAAVVLSLATELTAPVFVHRASGRAFSPEEGFRGSWSPDALDWLRRTCDAVPPPPATEVEGALRKLAARLDEGAKVVLLNVSTFTPDEKVYSFGEGEPAAVTANRLDLVADRLAADGVVELVNVDRIIAEHGAGDHVVATARYSEVALGAIAEETYQTLIAVPALGGVFQSEFMRIDVPRYDRRTNQGTITRWHVAESAALAVGDPIFDIRFDRLHHRGTRQDDRSSRSLVLSVHAARVGYVRSILREEGSLVAVGDTVAIVTAEPDGDAPDDPAAAASFGVGVRVMDR